MNLVIAETEACVFNAIIIRAVCFLFLGKKGWVQGKIITTTCRSHNEAEVVYAFFLARGVFASY
jgi:hypothetical protein